MKREQDAAQRAIRTRPAVPVQQRKERVKMRQFLREIQLELKRVIWPTRQEVLTYSVVVIVVVLILTGLVFLLDVGFARGVVEIFRPVGRR